MNDCIIWTGGKGTNGYGVRYVDGKRWQAHRYAYFQRNGPIPDGLLVCHKCNIKPCVNADHLYLATNRQNILDASRDGRLCNQNTRKVVCSKCGGPFSFDRKGRFCKACKVAYNRLARAKKRAAMQQGGKTP